MNQTQKRLSIINLAISITDIETIQLQVLKLGLLKTDLNIQAIITALQTENYAQAQRLIKSYIDTPTENILQRTSQKKKPVITAAEQTTIDEFQLFTTTGGEEEKIEIDINDFLADKTETQRDQGEKKEVITEININDFLNDAPTIEKHQEEKEKVIPEIDINDFLRNDSKAEAEQKNNIDFDSLLKLDSDDVLANNIELDITHTTKDTFFESPSHKDEQPINTSDIPKDTFFNTEETIVEEVIEIEKAETIIENNILKEETYFQDLKPTLDLQEQITPSHYKAISYIDQKLESLQKQYPPVEQSDKNFSTVENLLKKISQEEYTEDEIEETLTYIQKLIEETQYAQAAQLLLISAATESKFAQFMLARELYKGILLTKNIPEAFSLINTLAMDDYPEALCDLGQFYENGIGTKKDKKRAQELYKEAMDLGIKRANVHHARIQKSSRGFFRR